MIFTDAEYDKMILRFIGAKGERGATEEEIRAYIRLKEEAKINETMAEAAERWQLVLGFNEKDEVIAKLP